MTIYTGDAGNNTIIGSSGDDFIDGREGNDILDGGAGNDILVGGPGADILTGGTGADTFRGTAADMNGDHITDFLIGDRIQFLDLTLADESNFDLQGNTLNYTGGSLQIDNLGPGRFVLREITGGGIEIRLQAAAHNDFSGDGRSDVLWRNDNGTISDWLGAANGSFVGNASQDINNVPASWKIVGTGDFNGDGRVDILWRNDNGTVSNWLGRSNGGFDGNSSKDVIVPNSWHIQATGDFNGDGITDILWRNDNGTVSDWLGQTDGSFVGNSTQDVNVPNSWQIVGTGDFNGDGRDDILWRNQDGTISDWLGQPNGGFVGNSAQDINSVPASWHVVATGDFNGDGRSDILWRNDNGTVSDWLGQENGGFVGNAAHDIIVPSSWHIVGVGDYNGDAIDDILWRNDTGTVSRWLGASDGSFAGNPAYDVNVPTSWHIQDPAVHDPFL